MIDRVTPPDWQYYLNPWWREKRIYSTRLGKAECQRRLNETTTRFLGSSVVRSMVSATDFTLHRWTFYNNGFKPYAYVKIDDTYPAESRVEVTFSASGAVRLFFVVWYAFIAVFATLVVGSAIGRQPTGAVALPLGFVAAFVAWPLILTAFGRGLAHGDRDFLSRFLLDQLDLTPAGQRGEELMPSWPGR